MFGQGCRPRGSRRRRRNLRPISKTPPARKETDARLCERGVVKTTRQRAEERRQVKLDLVREQLESGSLVIRRMTEEERRRYPPRPAQPKRRGRR